MSTARVTHQIDGPKLQAFNKCDGIVDVLWNGESTTLAILGLSHLAEQLEAVVLIPSGEFQFHSERSLVAVGCGEVAGAAA
ncbi:MAG: hypothetical protein ACKVP7_14825, partial [Hyphomicrobiaceae bacterium]